MLAKKAARSLNPKNASAIKKFWAVQSKLLKTIKGLSVLLKAEKMGER